MQYLRVHYSTAKRNRIEHALSGTSEVKWYTSFTDVQWKLLVHLMTLAVQTAEGQRLLIYGSWLPPSKIWRNHLKPVIPWSSPLRRNSSVISKAVVVCYAVILFWFASKLTSSGWLSYDGYFKMPLISWYSFGRPRMYRLRDAAFLSSSNDIHCRTRYQTFEGVV